MPNINGINNFNETNFNNLPIINNEFGLQENVHDIQWVIDRIPDLNLINNINNNNHENDDDYDDDDVNSINNLQNIRNQYFEQLTRAQALMDGIIQEHDDNYISTDDNTPLVNHEPDFIPFISVRHIINIIIEVQLFIISEEDCNCCICMETRENEQICQFNCLHKFCIECTLTHFRRNRQRTFCPLCRTPVTNISVQTEAVRETFI